MADNPKNINEGEDTFLASDQIPEEPTSFGDRTGGHQQRASTHGRKPRLLHRLKELFTSR